ncbi:MAG: polymer-forming cytoskeletal protein [Thermoanaerobaculia bacterium]
MRVDGKVDGDAVALGGPVTIDGEVTGDVSSVGGSVHLESHADVHGDVVSVGGQVTRDPGAHVGGRIEEVPFRWHVSGDWKDAWLDGRDYSFDFSPWHHWMRVGWRVFWVLFVALLASIALLVARRPIERMERRIEHEVWKAGLTGLLAQVLAIPVLVLVCVVLAISVIGIPVLLLVPFALVFIALAAFGGFVAMARVIGRWLERRFGRDLGGPYAELLAGLAMVYVFSLVGHLLNAGPLPLRFMAGMSLVIGTLIWYAAWTIGFGASILTRFGTAASWERPRDREPLPPVPAVPQPGAEDPPFEGGGPEEEPFWDDGRESEDDAEP